ncbi:hypothetical protein C0J50_9300, partial [Silurus asotus]
PAGKTLEWIGRIFTNGGTDYSDKLKNKFSISRDTSTNTIIIKGQNMQTEDTAVYYCARDPTVTHITNIPVQKHPVKKTVYQQKQNKNKIIEQVQTAVMVVKPGESSSVISKITEYSATSYCTNWLQHTSGKVLEWINCYCNSSNTDIKDSLKNNIHFSAEASSNTVILLYCTGQNMQTEDTAVYYCARDPQ